MNDSNTRRLSPVDRTINTTPPSTTSPSTTGAPMESTKVGPMILTPPTSPANVRSFSDSTGHEITTPSQSSNARVKEDSSQPAESRALSLPPSYEQNFTVCPFDVKILSNRHGGNEIFGSGAWSTVYKAIRQPAPSSVGLITPPSSPVAANPFLLAVKVPMRKDAEAILEHEGEILKYLSSLTNSEKFITPFFGVIPKFSSLVLGAVPLSLEEHITVCAVRAKQTLTTWNMSEPVIGSTRTWLDLAHKIVSGLHWLHEEAGVVHGDIKPGNFLLKPLATEGGGVLFPYQPVFIDFSSSYVLENDKPTPNMLSAVTREYTAPELQTSAVLRDPKSSTTFASDIFSTAVTLLVAATGDTKVYSGSVFQRQAMATQGWQVLQLVQGSDQGARVPRHSVVERALEQAVLRAGMGRVSAGKWLDIVEEMMAGEPSKTA